MARMSIDDKFPRDPRVVRLGKALAWSRRETIGALIDVFQIAYDREIDVLPEADIDTAAERDGFTVAMIEVGLAERMRGGGVRIKGAKSRIRYLTDKTEAGKLGGVKSGESRRNQREAKRSSASSTREAVRNPPDPVPDDPPVPDPAPVQDQIPYPTPARAIPPVVVRAEPGGSSSPVDGGEPGPRHSRPRATQQGAATPGQSASLAAGNVAEPHIDPTPDRVESLPSTGGYVEPEIPTPIRLPVAWSGPPDHRAVESRRRISMEIRDAVNAARRRVSEAVTPRVSYRPLDAQDPGERQLMAYLVGAGDLGEARATLLHVVEMAETEAVAKNGLQWLTLKAIFSEGNRTRFAGGTAAEFARKPAKARAMADVRATPEEMAVARKVLAQLSEDSAIQWRVEDGHASHVVDRLRELVRSGVDPYRAGRELQAVVTDRGDAWKGKDKMSENLKPSTVFGEKFAEYRSIALARYGADIRRDVERRADEKRKAGA